MAKRVGKAKFKSDKTQATRRSGKDVAKAMRGSRKQIAEISGLGDA